MNLLSSTVFSFFTLISRILGYLRDILIAIFLGASIFADAFFVAFRLPNTFRRLFAEGTFNAAFIPSYTSAKIEDKKGKKFADDVLSSLLIILLFIVTIVEIFTPYLIYIIAPGFLEDQIKFNLAVELTRITFPFLLFVSLSSFLFEYLTLIINCSRCCSTNYLKRCFNNEFSLLFYARSELCKTTFLWCNYSGNNPIIFFNLCN